MKRASLIVLLALAGLAAAATGALAAPEKAAGGIRFTYTDPNAGTVAWAGEFNGWNASATPMVRGADGVWSVVVPLGPGEHQYKFVVDGQWLADPENPVTKGDFGNSAVKVDDKGQVVTAQVGAVPSPLNPKIFVNGRFYGLFWDIWNPQVERFELRRPTFDLDLDVKAQASDQLEARVLMNINAEAEDVEAYRSRLNFDRGHLLFKQPRLEILAWDNESSGTWDDPLRLVGAVGQYDYDYGYGRQGVRLKTPWLGFRSEFQYSDNFVQGGTTYPDPMPATEDGFNSDTDGFTTPVPIDLSGGAPVLVPGTSTPQFTNFPTSLSDANEDVLALRVQRPLGGGFELGLLGRSDRGFNLDALALVETLSPDRVRVTTGRAYQEWFAWGGEAIWADPTRGFSLRLELMSGRWRASTLRRDNEDAATYEADAVVDTNGLVTISNATEPVPANGRAFRLDVSNRFALAGRWAFAEGDVVLDASVERQTHDYELILEGLANRMDIWAFRWDRNWRYYLGREVKTSVGVEFTDFTYDLRTPWAGQLWYPTYNFWLDQEGHKVRYDRLVMLGGDDVWTLKPVLEVPFWSGRNGTFKYSGLYNLTSLDRIPKYAESIFQAGFDLTSQLRFMYDGRWVKYDDPFLQLSDGYVSNFFDLQYTFAPGITFSASFGVDPWRLDEVPNEFRYWGRDDYLFGRGATATQARNDYYSMGPIIAAAEKALRDERRIQLEAIVRF